MLCPGCGEHWCFLSSGTYFPSVFSLREFVACLFLAVLGTVLSIFGCGLAALPGSEPYSVAEPLILPSLGEGDIQREPFGKHHPGHQCTVCL
jgi:hypothetical protein